MPQHPPPSGLQPKHLPKHLPKLASTDLIERGKKPYECITLSKAYKSKIDFAWDDNNVCYEVDEIIKPYLKCRIPGSKKILSKKLNQFAKVQIDKTIYLLEN